MYQSAIFTFRPLKKFDFSERRKKKFKIYAIDEAEKG